MLHAYIYNRKLVAIASNSIKGVRLTVRWRMQRFTCKTLQVRVECTIYSTVQELVVVRLCVCVVERERGDHSVHLNLPETHPKRIEKPLIHDLRKMSGWGAFSVRRHGLIP